ncbi:MAG: ATP-binding cassette domain-containing protein [Cytophagales bacterium]|nr:ATP-binding cassette domain-containing protein [Bernardetiaceae bacterium]MDW8209454.1 ATP-binding cassette domain-containing protein [Cytophagales bacterium]
MLELKSVSHYYHQVRALHEIHLTFLPGQVHGIVGTNGAGKTTLLMLISQLLKIQQGTIELNRKAISSTEVAFLPAHTYLYHYITGQEYLALFQAHNPSANFEVLNRIFRLPLHRLVDEYSTGMRKKLALMGLIALNRPVFVLDEPFNSVDMEGVFAFQEAIKWLAKQGKIILITSHIFESLASVCDYIHYLQEGVICGSYDQSHFDHLHQALRHQFEQSHQPDWQEFFGFKQ